MEASKDQIPAAQEERPQASCMSLKEGILAGCWWARVWLTSAVFESIRTSGKVPQHLWEEAGTRNSRACVL